MPQSLLHVQHTSSNNAFIKAVRYNDNTGTVIGNHNRDIHIGPVFEEGNGITTKTEGIHIRSNGRVGIGTVLPLEMLDVRGSITADGYVYAASAQFDRGYNYNPALQLGTSTTYLVKPKTRYIELYHQHKLEKIEHDKNREYYKEYYKRFMDGSMKD